MVVNLSGVTHLKKFNSFSLLEAIRGKGLLSYFWGFIATSPTCRDLVWRNLFRSYAFPTNCCEFICVIVQKKKVSFKSSPAFGAYSLSSPSSTVFWALEGGNDTYVPFRAEYFTISDPLHVDQCVSCNLLQEKVWWRQRDALLWESWETPPLPSSSFFQTLWDHLVQKHGLLSLLPLLIPKPSN